MRFSNRPERPSCPECLSPVSPFKLADIVRREQERDEDSIRAKTRAFVDGIIVGSLLGAIVGISTYVLGSGLF